MKIPRVAIVLGVVSLLTDIASEMVYPLLPRLIEGLGGSAVILGLIEGVGDATASVFKLVSGRLADRVERRKPLVLAGYGLSSVVRPLIAFASAPWQVVGVRFLDRIGKGIRSSPRDALLAASAPREQAGAIFGFHRAMDNVGAMVGPLLVAVGLWLLHDDVHRVLLMASVPGFLAVLTILFFVRGEAPAPRSAPSASAPPSRRPSPSALRAYLLILGFFALINTSDLFLLRRLSELGASTSGVAGAFGLLNLVRAAGGYPGGRLADRIGRARCMMLGWGVYALSYAVMSRASGVPSFVAGLVIYGLFYGLTEGAERALVAQMAPREVLGSAFGRFNLVTGIVMLPSNLLFGLAWDRFGGPPCLLASALGALMALAGLGSWAAHTPAESRGR
jgi:MFS family permease